MSSGGVVVGADVTFVMPPCTCLLTFVDFFAVVPVVAFAAVPDVDFLTVVDDVAKPPAVVDVTSPAGGAAAVVLLTSPVADVVVGVSLVVAAFLLVPPHAAVTSPTRAMTRTTLVPLRFMPTPLSMF